MKACPLCSTISINDVYCPRCRRVHIIAKMMTLQELKAKLRKNIAGKALIERAVKALEG